MFDLELIEQGSQRGGAYRLPGYPVTTEKPVRAFARIYENKGDFVSEKIVKVRNMTGEGTTGRAPVREDAKPDVLFGPLVAFAMHVQKVLVDHSNDRGNG